MSDDALYCEEGRFEEDDGGGGGGQVDGIPLFPSQPADRQQDSPWADEDGEEKEEEEAELQSLFSKERGARPELAKDDWGAVAARREAVEWMLMVRGVYGFSALTAVLAVDYLDRFLAGFRLQRDNRPWMTQLVAVTCLALAAKVEETHVPFLVELQEVGDARYVFEAKTVQRMELLVLSTLGWEMHPVTPLSFVHHVARRLGASPHHGEFTHWAFLRRCERLLVAAVSDARSLKHLPSVLAAAAMLRVIEEVEPFRSSEYKAQLLSALHMSQEMVEDCCRFILGIAETAGDAVTSSLDSFLKRKRRCGHLSPRSPSGVIDASFSCDDESNDSWATDPPSDPDDNDDLNPLPKKSRSSSPSSSSSSSSVPDKVLDLPFMNRIFEGIVNGSPI